MVNVDDCFALLEAPSQRTALGLRDRCMLELLYGAGLRVSELVGLDLGDLIDGETRCGCWEGPQGADVRCVPKARAALLRWLSRRAELKPKDAALFVNRSGCHHRPAAWPVTSPATR